jgi:hypothetical protein
MIAPVAFGRGGQPGRATEVAEIPRESAGAADARRADR